MKPPFPVTAKQVRAAAESLTNVTITGAQAKAIGQLTVWGPSRRVLVAPIPDDPDGCVFASFEENPASAGADWSTYVISGDGDIGHYSEAAYGLYEKFDP